MLRGLFRSLLKPASASSPPESARLAAAVVEAHGLMQSGDFAGARQRLDRVFVAEPGNADAWLVLGMLRERQGDGAARDAYERAVAGRENFAAAHMGLGNLLLRDGHWTEGWAHYEWRTEMPDYGMRIPLPRWRGEALGGKRLLAVAEQGFGDTMMFLRYLPQLRGRAGALAVLCRPPLQRLIRSSFPEIAVHTPEDFDAAAHDLMVPILSVPHALGGAAAAPRRECGYLRLDAELAARWRLKTAAGSEGAISVGLVWAGNVFPDRNRSVPVEMLRPLAEANPRVRWISLQAHAGAAPRLAFAMQDPMDEVADFADTAAIVAALDLVISIDTSVAHLAAGLARPLWLLAPAQPCWRWIAAGEESPWYPEVRIFRPSAPNAWTPVVAQVAEALRGLR